MWLTLPTLQVHATIAVPRQFGVRIVVPLREAIEYSRLPLELALPDGESLPALKPARVFELDDVVLGVRLRLNPRREVGHACDKLFGRLHLELVRVLRRKANEIDRPQPARVQLEERGNHVAKLSEACCANLARRIILVKRTPTPVELRVVCRVHLVELGATAPPRNHARRIWDFAHEGARGARVAWQPDFIVSEQRVQVRGALHPPRVRCQHAL
mmetsp:Transcript_48273/g.103075  ORF Transcript_48273/g.103075 Transcript_48273/m.103075 type:complete len:215 (-) Transcript_48273:219-863(-)